MLSQTLLFRDIFVHIDLKRKIFELPAAEVWIRDDKLVDNLISVIDTDIQNISELVEFE